ncbi:MAG TPA: hypothetical protein VFS77_15395, partial [Pyrinomonadaceae bacterium]|nr:hypothetical protein [Pyrinomonadaceae bacterium]
MQNSKQNPEKCGCCEGVEALTPVAIFNRPGLDAVAFRAGTHASFYETMQARLSSSEFPQLAALTTRETHDPSMALLDAWAMVGDVLTFYQERIANEGYLRTAIERRSVLELARLVGYRLKPGLSSSVYLAYTLEPTQDTTLIDIGNKAQSLPGPNELPQIFETAEKLMARSSLNVMKPRLTQPQIYDLEFAPLSQLTLIVKGTATGLSLNDALLVEITMLFPVQPEEVFYRVAAIKTEPTLDRTVLTLSLQGPLPDFPEPLVFEVFNQARDFVTKYLDIEAFGLSATLKTVEKTVDRLNELKTVAEATNLDTPTMSANVKAEIDSLQSFLTGQYAFASARGWGKIATWLAMMVTDINKLESNIATFNITETTRGAQNGTPHPKGLPSFVELFAPFKLPQSIQPNGEANLKRTITSIYSPRSEFVARMYGVINPQAERFVEAVLANAISDSPPSSPKAEGFVQLTSAQALRTKAFMAGHNLPIVRENVTIGVVGVVGDIVLPPNL